MPSEDYSRWPPCYAVFLVKGRQTKTNSRAQKKTMKTTTKKNQKSGLESQSEQLRTENRPDIDFALRRVNRELETEKLLALLRSEAPRFLKWPRLSGSGFGFSLKASNHPP